MARSATASIVWPNRVWESEYGNPRISSRPVTGEDKRRRQDVEFDIEEAKYDRRERMKQGHYVGTNKEEVLQLLEVGQTEFDKMFLEGQEEDRRKQIMKELSDAHEERRTRINGHGAEPLDGSDIDEDGSEAEEVERDDGDPQEVRLAAQGGLE